MFRAGLAGVRAGRDPGSGHERRRFDGFVEDGRGSSGGLFQQGRKSFRLLCTTGADAAAFLRTGLLGLYLRATGQTFDDLRESFKKLSRSPLTGGRGWAYIPAIDAAADATGAQIFLRTRAVGPDLGRDQGLFCGGLFLSVTSDDVVLFDIVEREEKRRRRCPCGWPLAIMRRHRPDLCFGEYTASALAGVRWTLSI
jgi:hypothetical protein